MSMQGWHAMRSLTKDDSVKDRKLAPGTSRRVMGYARPYRREIAVFVALVVVAVVGPVVAGLLGPALPSLRFAMAGQAFALLACALLAVVLILAALLAQVDEAPQTERSCEQRTMSMNGPPGALVTELDRRLQDA